MKKKRRYIHSMKHRRREWLVSRAERQKQKEIRLAKKRKNWWYHHKWQIIAKATGRVQVTRIRFPKHVYLSDPNEKIFKIQYVKVSFT